jgi:hypothetical protein
MRKMKKEKGQTDILMSFDGNQPNDVSTLFERNVKLNERVSQDDIIGALVKTICHSSPVNDADKSSSIQRLLLLKIASRIEKDQSKIKKYFYTVLTKSKLGTDYQRNKLTLHASLNKNTPDNIKKGITEYISSIEAQVRKDLDK